MDQDPSIRRASALNALRAGRPPESASATFWRQHGGKIIFGVLLLAGLWIFARAVGRFMSHSASETERAQEVIRRGVR